MAGLISFLLFLVLPLCLLSAATADEHDEHRLPFVRVINALPKNSKPIKSGKHRLQRASTPIGNSASTSVTPRPTATDSPTKGHSSRHQQITSNPLQRHLHRTIADLRLQQPNQRHKTISHPQTYHYKYRLVVPPSKSSASASVILFSCHRPQPHRPQPLATDRLVETAGDNHHL
ncbi:hypothetical protein NC651_000590 [Populus alba x Populus x berolinensis]|nr:hypothetical protein NC651_000590 [Populus alba x Populus x berolinensis]